MNRLAQLKELLVDTPNDPFLHYAIVTEQYKEDEAVLMEQLSRLAAQFPHYGPIVRKLGELYSEKEEEELAIKYFTLALTCAKQAGNEKEIIELQSKLEWLQF